MEADNGHEEHNTTTGASLDANFAKRLATAMRVDPERVSWRYGHWTREGEPFSATLAVHVAGDVTVDQNERLWEEIGETPTLTVLCWCGRDSTFDEWARRHRFEGASFVASGDGRGVEITTPAPER